MAVLNEPKASTDQRHEMLARKVRTVEGPTDQRNEVLAQKVRAVAAATSDERRECTVCLDEPRSVRFQTCGHLAVCPGCYDMLKALEPSKRKCPLCNVHFDGRARDA